jgi:putative hydrolase of the HAD superfamily
MISALILDMDNTVFPSNSISDELFEPIYQLLEKHKDKVGEENIQEIKKLMSKKAWQKISEEYDFNDELTKEGADILRETTYHKPITLFDDYSYIKELAIDKHLVTMGFTKMQWSKIKMLNIEGDYKDIVVNDPEKTEGTKKEVFESIIKKYNLNPQEVLVIGDDPDSEIKAGNDLQMPTVLYDRMNEYEDKHATHHIHNYSELAAIMKSHEG